jgi:hypothetical protein
MATPNRNKKKTSAPAKPAQSAKARPAAPSAPKKKPEPASRLAASVDGKELDGAGARALWVEFSSYMDEHEGDFDGFARSKGWHSVRPEHRAGRAVLIARTKP